MKNLLSILGAAILSTTILVLPPYLGVTFFGGWGLIVGIVFVVCIIGGV